MSLVFSLSTGEALSGVHRRRDDFGFGSLVGAFSTDASSFAAEVTSFPNPDGVSTATPAVGTTSGGASNTFSAVAGTADDTSPTGTTAAADQWTPSITHSSPTPVIASTVSSSAPDDVTSEPATTTISVASTILISMTSSTTATKSILPSSTEAASQQSGHGNSTTETVEAVGICLACLTAFLLTLLLWRVLKRRKHADPHIPALSSTNYTACGEDLRWHQTSPSGDTRGTESDTLQFDHGKHYHSNYDSSTDESAEVNSLWVSPRGYRGRYNGVWPSLRTSCA
ncbi:hypothetical protein GY45DRAFT_1136733 [Cubamyces sp. BRFM 1775]|nr:hypothetical protein GY45DRAFT_1136733 [Cubamyces sp. BRFM 1775]